MPNINVYPRYGQDTSNYFSDICPNCGKIHHVYSLASFACVAGSSVGYGTIYTPVVVNQDLPSGDYVSIAFGNSLFIAAGPNGLSSSANGTTWTLRSFLAGAWQDTAYKTSLYLAVGYDQWYNGLVASSANGTTGWALVALPAGVGQLNAVVWNGSNLFVAIGPNTCITSPDGATWTKRTISTGNWISIEYNGSNLYMALDATGLVATSPDGVTWTLKTALAVPCKDVAFGNSVFCAVGTNVCYTSADGVVWVARTIPAAAYAAITWNGSNLFVALGASKCATSADGTTWANQAGVQSGNWLDVAYDGSSVYAAVGSGAAAQSSANAAVTWTARTITGGREQILLNNIAET